MAYEDEKMIKAMNAYKKGTYGSLEEGFFIREELVEFKKEQLFDGKMQMMLPVSFTDMPMELAKLKYPMEQCPQVIKSNEATDINFTFSLADQPLTNDQVKQVRDSLKRVLKTVRPDMRFMEEGMEEMGEGSIGWFELTYSGIDTKIYNIMYFTTIAGKMMHGIFNCPAREAVNWKRVVFEMMRTIKSSGDMSSIN
ncbi:MAG: hypothetical protein NC307_15765 [Roseburia sp.]|nr:hypothetical protein [Roseburia sp.]